MFKNHQNEVNHIKTNLPELTNLSYLSVYSKASFLFSESNAFLNDNLNSAGVAIGSSLAVIVIAIMVLLGLLHMKYGNVCEFINILE